MNKIAFCVGATFLSFTSPVVAQDRPPFDSGNDFLRGCPVTWKTECMAFVVGVFQGSQVQRKTMCLPQRVDTGQLYEVAIAYIRSHPERAHELPVGLLLESWEAAFPCA